MKESESLRALVSEYRVAATALPLALEPVQPSSGVRRRLLETVAPPVQRAAPVFTRVFWAAAACALFALIVASLWHSPEPREMAFVGTKAAPDAHGNVRCIGRSVDFVVTGLPGLPPEKCYQLWHIGTDKSVIAQATFTVDSSGVLRGSDAMTRALGSDHVLGITMEPVGGSKSPTSPIYAIARY